MTMRVMVLGTGNRDTEAGVRPSDAAIRAMVEFNGELTTQGVLLDAQGLMPTAAAKRVRFELDQRRVIDGPFAESKELIAGYWIWQVRSIDEAVEWLLRAPATRSGRCARSTRRSSGPSVRRWSRAA
jgi:hypothetical protein